MQKYLNTIMLKFKEKRIRITMNCIRNLKQLLEDYQYFFRIIYL